MKPGGARILVVDDEPGLRDVLSILFRREGFQVTLAPGFVAAREAIQGAPSPFALVLTDVFMPDGSGLDILSLAKSRSAQTEVIVMTAHSSVENAIEAMKRGATDFITKPFANSELRERVHKALEKGAIVAENERLKAQVSHDHPRDLLGHSAPIRRIHDLISRVAKSRGTVLITGESGTGKERVARALHDASDRAEKPFLVVNCGAIPEALIESELFGHDKGAFTGAIARHLGIFREADGGTVLLDEVGELAASLQVKLLRVLQEKKIRGIGSSGEVSIDVRVLAATNRRVEDDVKSGKFRQDLYYRLNVIRIEVPSLRDRREDIGELANFFLARCAAEYGKDIHGFTPDALRALDGYDFPGNVRELENVVERAVTLASGPIIDLGDLPAEISGAASQPTPSLVVLPDDGCNLDDVLGEIERRLILQALDRSGGVRTHAARLLGLSLRSLRYRLQKLSLEEDDTAGPASSPPDLGTRIRTVVSEVHEVTDDGTKPSNEVQRTAVFQRGARPLPVKN
ncbi:MAG: sigma-54 dependent transcriptional regulator [Myxococcales bacterium]